MRKILLWLVGLLLMGILAYFCFMEKSDGIKEHLVSDVQRAYAGEEMNWVDASLKGQGLDMTRTIVLEGTAPSTLLKDKAARIAAGIVGVSSVENNVKAPIKALSQKQISTDENSTEQASLPIAKSENIIAPHPYILKAKKNKEGLVTLSGYVENASMHDVVVNKAEVLFGKKNIVDTLKEAEGAVQAWDTSALLGLEKLSEVTYGELEMSGTDFHFNGYLKDVDKKEALLESLQKSLDGRYLGHYTLDAPVKEVVDAVVEAKEETVEVPAVKPVKNRQVCKQKLKKIMTNGKVHFAYNRAGIKPRSFILLDAIVKAVKECPHDVITIGGHTDSIGSKEYNQLLSTQRAASVKKYLVSEGISANRIKAQGYGESQPVAENMLKAGRAKNRRIEFGIQGVKK